jgi:phenylacetate-CoA ligase
MYSSALYLNSPSWLQTLMLSARGLARRTLREGQPFRQELAEVERSQWLSAPQLAALQLQRLRANVEHAARHVPHYRDKFAALGISAEDIRSLADVARLPVLTKREVFDAGPRMLAENHRGVRVTNSTSGTTGLSMHVYRDLHSINRENAFGWRQYRWAGAKLGDRRVWLRGDKIVPAGQRRPPFWRYSHADNMIMMSSYHLSEATAGDYVRALEGFDPVFGLAYPSAILFMARHLLSRGQRYRGRQLRGFVTSSETVTEEHRRLVRQAFGCPIYDWYGCAERVAAIGTCEQGNYHILSDYSLLELEPQDDGSCQVIGTSFDNQLMPWIRYRLGDAIVPADPGYACPCGRAFPVVERIVGRIDDHILTPDGRHVFMLSNALDHIPGLLEGQVRQDSPDEVQILLVPAPGARIDEGAVAAAVRAQVGEGLRVAVRTVAEIPRTSNGKLRMVVRTI